VSEGVARSWAATLQGFWSWQMEAACRSVDTTLFYSPEGERGPRKTRRELAAKQVCADCPVLEVCSTYAIAMREPYGTWGGLSEGERRALWTRLDPVQAKLDHRRAFGRWERHAHARGA
jgi:WhiB family transcriptional regulator, redox-sensing transcriptional regulator